ncbi:DUF4403 family protein [Sphingobium sp. AP49]|uniref:DUF4403 family protein n=1 Tax=Sphingobium sp. AP49 TaxID=1144307 RepID=UPI000563DFF3|nr:DUF4403 family protein [Sphingobium sp. AP49]WHO37378.1 DUF4403 family protein [Sphingobium sp. AP49]
MRIASSLCLALLLAACSGKDKVEAPPRATDPVPSPQGSSVITVPIEIDRTLVLHAIEQALPRELWSINQPGARCVPPQHVKLLGKKINVTPVIKCTIVGTVTRGAIRLHGQGRELIADVPIRATVAARDVAGVLKGETATGGAMAHARLSLSLAPDWSPHGTVRLSYDWTTPPGIDFLGQRIAFGDKVDEKLRPLIAKLQQQLPQELAKVALRPQVEKLWSKAFTSISLNRENPPVWMRVTPQRLLFDGYAMEGDRLRINLGIQAVTETVVGDRPADPKPTPLPPPAAEPINGDLRFFIPVRADYAQLEPVILRALQKRAKRPFDVPKVGALLVRFDKVIFYGTTGNRVAAGVDLAVRGAGGKIGETKGRIWLTARPVNAPNSPVIHFQDLSVMGDSNGVGGDLIIAVASSPSFAPAIADALSQNFAHDLDKLMVKIRHAIGERDTRNFHISTSIDKTEIGQIAAYGQGLYLPVRAGGRAHILYDPRQN